MKLIEILSDLDRNDEVHLARLLILLSAFVQDENTTVNGLTKLVKLDFLLRYPTCLERALKAKRITQQDVNILDHERKSVESGMIRYHYGPWDPRYRRFINLLVGKGLVTISLEGRTIRIGLTRLGFDKASVLSRDSSFDDVAARAKILEKYFDIGAMRLKDFIYETFPEITSLRLGEEIQI